MRWVAHQLASLNAWCVGLLVLGVAGCGGSEVPREVRKVDRTIEKQLRGKTLSNETGARFTLGRDGTLTGPGVSGTWWVEGARVCRTLVAPETMVGTSCQTVVLNGDRVAFQSPGGRILSFQIED